MIAAPRCWTLAMNSPSQPLLVADHLGCRPPADARVPASGNWVDEWLPQIARSRDLADVHAGPRRQLATARGSRRASSSRTSGRFAIPWRAAAVEPISAFVLHGLPTTSTRQSSAALRAIAVPWPVKMPPLMLRRSLRSIPSLRGTAPTSRAQFAPANASSVSEVRDHFVEQRKGAVLELHAHALERRHRSLQLEQLERHRRFGSECLARRDPEEERVADLAGGAGHGDANGGVRHQSPVVRGSSAIECSAAPCSVRPRRPSRPGRSPSRRMPCAAASRRRRIARPRRDRSTPHRSRPGLRNRWRGRGRRRSPRWPAASGRRRRAGRARRRCRTPRASRVVAAISNDSPGSR